MFLIGLFDEQHPAAHPKGKSKERVMNVCLHITWDKRANTYSYYTRTLYGVLKKTNKGLS